MLESEMQFLHKKLYYSLFCFVLCCRNAKSPLLTEKENEELKDVAIKVFKTTLTDFKNRANYVKGDVRFFRDEFKKQNPRKIMRIWAEKEQFNLRRLARFNVPCPRVLYLKKHVLVMTYIGKNRRAAPKLKEAKLSFVDLQLAYEQVVDVCAWFRTSDDLFV